MFRVRDYFKILCMQLKNTFNLNRNICGQGHANCTAGSFSVFLAKNINHQLAESVNGLRVLLKIGIAVHHSKCFNQPFNPV